jgi:hypothetical protein
VSAGAPGGRPAPGPGPNAATGAPGASAAELQVGALRLALAPYLANLGLSAAFHWQVAPGPRRRDTAPAGAWPAKKTLALASCSLRVRLPGTRRSPTGRCVTVTAHLRPLALGLAGPGACQ